jgi:hypothetical protein
MRLPEARRFGDSLHEFGCGPRKIAASEGLVPEDVAQTIAELIAHFGNLFVRGSAIGTGIAAVFHKGDFGVVGPQNMISLCVDGPVEPLTQDCSRHLKASLRFA